MFRSMIAALVLVFAMGVSHALDLSLGAAMTVSTSPYKKHDATYLPAPMINYEGDRLFFHNSAAGVYLFKNDNHKVGLGVSLFALHFDPDDTKNAQLKKLEKRKMTLMGDISYEFITKFGLGKLKASRDLLGYSDGYMIDAGFFVPFIRDCFTIMPGAGVQWSSRKQSDYYFGISRGDSERSGLKRHSAKANFSPYVQLEGKFYVNKNWSIVAGAYVNFLTGSVKQSPMVGKSVTIAGALGAQYEF